MLLTAALLTSCGRDNKPPPAPTTRVAQTVSVSLAGVDIYRQGLATTDSEESLRLLHEAVHANPRLAEAWYAIGRLKLKLAPDIVKTDEGHGVIGCSAKAWKPSGRHWRCSTRESSRSGTKPRRSRRAEALARDLQNVDEVMADQESLLAALRLRTY